MQLIGNEFEYSPKITQGTERWVDLVRHNSAQNALAYLRERGFLLVVLEPQETSEVHVSRTVIPVSQLPFEKRLALIFGNEREGVSKVLRQAADIAAYVPMKGFVESLNISVACAITLFCSGIPAVTPERRTAPLSEQERETKRSSWIKSGVRNSAAILKAVVHRHDWSEE